LYKIKDSLEKHLSTKTNELFDLQDKIYDVVYTYSVGEYVFSKKIGDSSGEKFKAQIIAINVKDMESPSPLYIFSKLRSFARG
jgi:putative lipoic acid-binding regulatory protein